MPHAWYRWALVTSCTVCLAITAACTGCDAPDPNVTTQHNDNFRTGAYLAETTLTPQRVANQGMHIKYWIGPQNGFLPSAPPGRPVGVIDGGIYTQLLYLRGVPFERKTANGLFAGTARAKVYAFNADNGHQEWVKDLMDFDPGPCRVPRTLDTTPVIDHSNNRIFVVFSTEAGNVDGSCGDSLFGRLPVHFFLASLDVRNGAGFSKMIQAKDDASNVGFVEWGQNSHPGLLLDNGSLYLAFGSDAALEGAGVPFRGWVMRYNASDLALRNAFTTSRSESGAGVWQGGGGLAADGKGSVFFLTGNGKTDFGQFVAKIGGGTNHLYGDTFMRLSLSGGTLHPAAFALEWGCAEKSLCAADADLGSGGAMIIPDSNNVVGGGKTGIMYLLDRTSMARLQDFEASTNQYHPEKRGEDWESGPHLHGSPTYWRGPDPRYGNLYVWGEKDYLKLYRYDTQTQRFHKTVAPAGKIAVELKVLPYAQGVIKALPTTMPGGTLSVSADGNNRNSGIVWATLPVMPCLPSSTPCWLKERPPFPYGVYAFEAETLKLLWNDATFSVAGPHWAPPTIADGTVYVPWGEGMIVAYDLCRAGTECWGSSQPIQPVTPGPCGGVCHSTPFRKESLVYTPRALRFESEGAFAALPKLTLRAIAPAAKAIKDIVMDGEGELVYEAAEATEPKGTLTWRLHDQSGDFTEFRAGYKGGADAKEALRIQVAAGMKWSASDGSNAVAKLEKSSPAPEKTDGPWALYRLASDAGQGALSTHAFAQIVYTDGGAPPEAAPKRRGEAARVKFRGQCWLYR